MAVITPQDKQFISQQIVIALQDNVGQRLTVALANGLLAQVLDALPVQTEPTDPPQHEHDTPAAG